MLFDNETDDPGGTGRRVMRLWHAVRQDVTNGHVLGVGAMLMLPLAVVAPAGLAPLALCLAVATAITSYVRTGRVPLGKTVALTLAAFLAYALASAVWAIDPAGALWMWARVAALFFSGLVLVDAAVRMGEAERAHVRRGLAAGLIAGWLLFAFEVSSNATVTMFLRDLVHSDPAPLSFIFNRAATILAVLAGAGMLLALRRGLVWLAAAMPLAAMAVIVGTESSAAAVALALGAVAFVAGWLAPRRVPLALAVMLAGGMLAAPLIVKLTYALPGVATIAQAPTSYGHRLRIWAHAVDLIGEKPIIGWGFDASRDLTTGVPPTDTLGPNADLMPLHPHNGALQIWVELGFVGAAIAAIAAAVACLASGRVLSGRGARAALAALVVSATTVACLSYGIWQEWWQGGLWLAAALTIAVAGGPSPRRDAGHAV